MESVGYTLSFTLFHEPENMVWWDGSVGKVPVLSPLLRFQGPGKTPTPKSHTLTLPDTQKYKKKKKVKKIHLEIWR